MFLKKVNKKIVSENILGLMPFYSLTSRIYNNATNIIYNLLRVFYVAILAFLIVGCASKQENTTSSYDSPASYSATETETIHAFNQNLTVPKSIIQNNTELIKSECNAHGSYTVRNKSGDYIDFSDKNTPYCSLNLGGSYKIFELKYNLKKGFNLVEDTVKLVLLPLTMILGTDGYSSFGIYKLIVADGYTKTGKLYEFSEYDQNKIVVQMPFEQNVSSIHIGIRAFYYPSSTKKPSSISGFKGSVELTALGERGLKRIAIYILQNRNDEHQNEKLYHELSLMDRNMFLRIKQMTGLKLPKDGLISFPDDIDIPYALRNYHEVKNGGEYKSIKGTYKRTKQNKVENTTEQKIDTSKYYLNTTGENMKYDTTREDKKEYIDFSEGI